MNFSEGFSWLGLMRAGIFLGSLLGMVFVPAAGLYFYIQNFKRHKPKMAVLAMSIPLIYIFTMLVWISCDLRKSDLVQTAENVSPKDVPFLKLPPTATNVGYWQDGNTWMAEFNITEKEFVLLLPKFSLLEITSPVTVQPKVYGDPKSVPYQNQLLRPKFSVANGLLYRTEQANGGGFEIVYDRAKSRGYFRYFGR